MFSVARSICVFFNLIFYICFGIFLGLPCKEQTGRPVLCHQGSQ